MGIKTARKQRFVVVPLVLITLTIACQSLSQPPTPTEVVFLCVPDDEQTEEATSVERLTDLVRSAMANTQAYSIVLDTAATVPQADQAEEAEVTREVWEYRWDGEAHAELRFGELGPVQRVVVVGNRRFAERRDGTWSEPVFNGSTRVEDIAEQVISGAVYIDFVDANPDALSGFLMDELFDPQFPEFASVEFNLELDGERFHGIHLPHNGNNLFAIDPETCRIRRYTKVSYGWTASGRIDYEAPVEIELPPDDVLAMEPPIQPTESVSQ